MVLCRTVSLAPPTQDDTVVLASEHWQDRILSNQIESQARTLQTVLAKAKFSLQAASNVFQIFTLPQSTFLSTVPFYAMTL